MSCATFVANGFRVMNVGFAVAAIAFIHPVTTGTGRLPMNMPAFARTSGRS